MINKVEVIGLKEFYDWLDDAGPVIKQEVRRENQASLLTILNDYKAGISKHGNLESGAVSDSNDGWMIGETGNTHKASIFIEAGTKAHPIEARNAAVLSFFWAHFGRQVFYKFVNHPGIKANPALLRAWLNHIEPIKNKYLARIVRRLDQRLK
jgi:hypothetical protein